MKKCFNPDSLKTKTKLKGTITRGNPVRHTIVIAFMTILSLYPIGPAAAFACGSINQVRFSNGLELVDGNVYLTTDLPSSVTIDAVISGTPGLILFDISGAVDVDNFQIFPPYNSPSFTVVPGDYTLVITVNDNFFAGGGLCEVMTINFSIAAPFAFSFDEDGEDWGVDLGKSKDGGHAFADYDNDGDLDLLVNTSSNSENSRLYRNNGDNTFTDVSVALAPEIQSTDLERACAWADVNNDGYLDFMRNTSYTGSPYANGAASMEIYIQDPITGIFGDGSGGTAPIDVGNTVTDHVDIGQHNTEGAGFFDFDGDGDIDIVFDNHNFGIDILRNNYINHLTRAVVNPPIANLFTHATPGTGVVLGLDQSATDGDYGSITDVDNDGWVDILMRKRDENDFFLNTGGTFTNGSDIADANNSNKGAVALYDFDNDGDFDAFWTENDANQIFRNDGPGVWTPLGASGTTGIPITFPSSDNIDEVSCGDLDNDGDIDILLVGDKESYLYINQINDPVFGKNVGSPMTFVQETSISFNSNQDGESTSMIDIDDDGDLDIYMIMNNSANLLWINDLYNTSTAEADKDYLFVKVLDDRSAYMASGAERAALGATVVLEDCDGNVLSGLREVNGGTGHGTQDPSTVHFGLPDGPEFSYRVIVKYPNYINAAGDTIRTVISKWIRPSEETSYPIVMYMRPDDPDIICPVEICGDGIDNDFDFLTDCEDSECGPPSINGLNSENPDNCPLLTNGSIIISAQGENLEYSIDNGANYFTDSTFYNLFSGSYDIVVRNSVTLCEDIYDANPVIIADPTCIANCDIGCDEVYAFDWWNGSAGQQWGITNGQASLTRNYTLTGASGNINVDVTLDNSDGQNIDFANCGTAGNHFYSATCDDPSAGADCDGDPGTVDGQFSYGCDFLTFGITSNNSSEQTSYTFNFQYPTRICQLTIGDIDAAGNGSNLESWQDEIDFSADSIGTGVDINVVNGGASTVLNNNTSSPNILANYTPGVDTNLDPSDAQGYAVISTERRVTSITITYSNGPDDDGESDDHAIWISSFDVCPSIQACRTATTNPHIMYYGSRNR